MVTTSENHTNKKVVNLTKKHIIITAFWDNRQDPRKLWEILRKPS